MCSPKNRQQNKTLHSNNQNIKEPQAQELDILLKSSDDYLNPVVMPFNNKEFENQLPNGKGCDNYKVRFVLNFLTTQNLIIFLFSDADKYK